MSKFRSYPAEVVGQSFANPDGSSRQAIIARMKVGDAVELRQEPANPHDSRAVGVHHIGGQIGYISRDRRWVWEQLERGQSLVAVIHALNEGPGAPTGVVLWITVPLKTGGPPRQARHPSRKQAGKSIISQLLNMVFR